MKGARDDQISGDNQAVRAAQDRVLAEKQAADWLTLNAKKVQEEAAAYELSKKALTEQLAVLQQRKATLESRANNVGVGATDQKASVEAKEQILQITKQ